MRRYVEQSELMAGFFKAYFLYGKMTYGNKDHDEVRLARASAYKRVMGLYQPFLLDKQRVSSDVLMQRFADLKVKAESLPQDTFKEVFLETLGEMSPRYTRERSD